MKTRLPFVVTLLVVSALAHADWADSGAAYRCDHPGQSFSIVSVMDTSSPEDTVSAPGKFSVVTDDISVECALRHAKVVTRFGVLPPKPTGTCGGVTAISLQSLQVNGKEVFELETLFNHYCLEDEALHSVKISESKGAARIRLCYAKWNWRAGYHDVRCVEKIKK